MGGSVSEMVKRLNRKYLKKSLNKTYKSSRVKHHYLLSHSTELWHAAAISRYEYGFLT